MIYLTASHLVRHPMTSNKKPGLIIRLIFEGLSRGGATITAKPFTLTLNDGSGTTESTLESKQVINVDDTYNPKIYKSKDDTTPELKAYITRDPNLFDNKYTLIFQATDKEGGIESVRVKEGNGDWKEAVSPYLLEDQSRHSTIGVRATNYSGGSAVVDIAPLSLGWLSTSNIVLVLVIIVVVFFFIRKKYVPKK